MKRSGILTYLRLKYESLISSLKNQEKSGGEKASFRIGKEQTVILIMAGVLLLVFGFPAELKTKKQGNGQQKVGAEKQKGSETAMSEASELRENYEKLLEKELANLLSMIDGAGEVKVMITFKDHGEQIALKDTQKNQKETFQEGGTSARTARESVLREETVFAGGSGEQDPFVVKTNNPKVEGVIVLAQGADSAGLKREITEAVETLFGIEANRVKVLKMGHIRTSGGIE